MFTIIDDSVSMDDLLKQSEDFQSPVPGSLVTGTVIGKSKNKILVDLNGVAVGIISGKETQDSFGTIKEIKEGDQVTAIVVEEENEEGLIVLSLRKASQVRAWDRFVKAFNEGEIIEVVAQEVNKGGLLLEVDGIKGFIPVSQLAPLHYPRVNNANSSEIVNRLQRLVGKKFQVKIINIDEENGKLILSEKEAMSEERASALGSLKVGQKVKGKISGIVKFGIFVTFEGLEGLVHISEIAWGHVKDTNEYGKVGDEVEVLVIGVDGEKISLSMKRLVDDPWSRAAENFKIGNNVKGIINRITPFGAFMKLTDDINGLIHLSEISHYKVDDPHNFLTIGQEIEAQVIAVDLDEHRIGLSIKALQPKPAEVLAEENKEQEKAAKAEELTENGEKEEKKKVKKEEKIEEEDKKEGTKKAKKEEKKKVKKEEKIEEEDKKEGTKKSKKVKEEETKKEDN